jgi:NAD+ synthase (glutamine-hydrolysing)
MKLALCQIDSTAGDLMGNTDLILSGIRQAEVAGAELAVFPELCVIGYPPNDLLLNRDFIQGIDDCLLKIAAGAKGIGVIVGAVQKLEGERARRTTCDPALLAYRPGARLGNAAFLISEGRIRDAQAKSFLPNYDVFDEARYFEPARERRLFEFRGHRFGVNVCEDIWVDDGPTEEQARLGAEFIINISSSPFYLGKWELRKELVRRRALDNQRPVFLVNAVGGQDSLIFDGGSFGFDGAGRLVALGKRFAPDMVLVDSENPAAVPGRSPAEVEETYQALLLGLRDYTNKNGFQKVVLGLSGGVDSALVAALAAAALRPERVVAVSMPGPYSSRGSVSDAKKLCENLYIELKTIPIGPVYQSYLNSLRPQFKEQPSDVTEENIQARIRGNTLMALSNKFRWLVLSTGNKSEVAVGYNTLYGDLAGGLSVISDVPKTLVYKICRYINEQVGRDLIPESVMTKAPSAELKPNQTDQDDLPPYEMLDEILRRYIEANETVEEIARVGFDAALVRKIVRRVDQNEYKRQQAPLGLKITPRAFGFGRRMPITNKFL